MTGCLYTCPACKDYYLYAPSGLPANIQDSIICPKCGHGMEMCQSGYGKKARAMKAEALALFRHSPV